jgi:hypothetical protein
MHAARLRHISGTKWGTRAYMDMKRPAEMDAQRPTNDAGEQTPREEASTAASSAA